MNTQHTPGPWKNGQAYENGEPACRTIRVGQQPICDVVTVPPMSEAESEANARLIAAAPELLEALRELERVLQAAYLHGQINVHGQDHCSIATARDQARAALAHATGQGS